jgi:phosphate transport system substrate-binding protein
MKKYLVLLLFVILLTGCSSKKETGTIKKDIPTSTTNIQDKANGKLEFTVETYPKVDGSTATIPLSQAIASKVLGLSKEESTKFIKHNTTAYAYTNLIQGFADIIFVTKPSDEELEAAKNAGVELEVVPIVKEGFIFIVNSKNPISNLTIKQIQDIYQGKIKNWKEVGGQNKEIHAFQREKNSGSQTLMEQLVMENLTIIDSPKDVIQEMGSLIKSVAGYDNSDNALGYSVLYYAKTMFSSDSIKLIDINGITPNNKNIASHKYPLETAYYAVIKKSDDSNSSSRKLINWILSEEGQKLAEEIGYVPLEER